MCLIAAKRLILVQWPFDSSEKLNKRRYNKDCKQIKRLKEKKSLSFWNFKVKNEKPQSPRSPRMNWRHQSQPSKPVPNSVASSTPKVRLDQTRVMPKWLANAREVKGAPTRVRQNSTSNSSISSSTSSNSNKNLSLSKTVGLLKTTRLSRCRAKQQGISIGSTQTSTQVPFLIRSKVGEWQWQMSIFSLKSTQPIRIQCYSSTRSSINNLWCCLLSRGSCLWCRGSSRQAVLWPSKQSLIQMLLCHKSKVGNHPEGEGEAEAERIAILSDLWLIHKPQFKNKHDLN